MHNAINKYLVKRHDVKRGNSWDCGIAVIGIIRKIRERHKEEMERVELGKFNFRKREKN